MTEERDAGFSFVEVLVSLTLLALIMVLLPGTIRLAARASTESAKLIQTSQGAEVTGFIRTSVSETLPILESDEDGAITVLFRGEAQSVEYVAPLAYGPEGGGLYRMNLRFVQPDGEASQSLMLDLVPYGRGSKALPDSRRLIDGVASGAIRYFGLTAGRPLPEWSSTWTRSDRLPDLIEIDMRLADSKAPAVAPLRIEPRLRRRD